MGVELFYHILGLLNEEINNYLPAKQLYSQCLEVLGQVCETMQFDWIKNYIFYSCFSHIYTVESSSIQDY